MPDGARAIPRPHKRRQQRRCSDPIDIPAYLLPSSRTELRELAGLMALAGWAPDAYRDLDGTYLQPRIEMAILHGVSVGLGPVAAVQSIAVIDGMPTIWGDGALALIERSGLLEDMLEEYVTDESEGLTAVCTMRRRGRKTPVSNRFSMAMAEQARLLQKEGPWQGYPQRMLKMRARSWTIRDGFADVLRGLHLREEVEDYAPAIRLAQPRVRFGKRPIPILSPRDAPHALSGSSCDAATIGIRTEPISAAVRTIPGAAERSCLDAKPASDGARPTFAETPAEDRVSDTSQDLHKAKCRDPLAVAADGEGTLAENLADSIALEEAGTEPAEQPYVLIDPDGIGSLLASPEALSLSVGEVGAASQPEGREPEPVLAQRGGAAPSAVRPERMTLTADGMVQTQHERKRADVVGHRWAVLRPKTLPRERIRPWSAEAIPETALALTIDPCWGDQRIFQHYRARLRQLYRDGAGKASALVSFRDANRAIEARLRRRLPHLISQIDAIYATAALNAR